MKKLPFILVLLFGFHLLNGQDLVSPKLNCLEVLPGGDVNIHWAKPDVEPTNFSHYEIFFSITNVNFVTFLSIPDYNTEFFNHLIGVADNGPMYYFIHSVDLSGNVSLDSDTLSTIYLNLNGQNFIAPIAEMLWNPLYSPEVMDTAQGTYFIERNYGLVWDIAGNSQFGDEAYSELVQICHGDQDSVLIGYRIALPNATGCVSRSQDIIGKYMDVNPPTIPDIETVSVDTASNNAVVCWYPSPEGDTQGYLVQEVVFSGLDTNYFTLNQTNDPSILSFNYSGSDASSLVEYFVVIPFDSCLHSGNSMGNTNGNINSSYMHQTIFVETELDRCLREVSLTWNKYETWDEGVLGYEIYGRENGGSWQLLGTRGPNGPQFTIGDLNIDSQYCFFVKALSSGAQKPSFSNTTCVNIEYPERPEFAYLSRVSILDDRAVEMTAHHSGGVNMKYRFERYDDAFQQFFEIETVTYLPFMGDEVYMQDQQSAPVNKPYQYRVSLIDSCNVNYINSNVSRNIDINSVANSNIKQNAIFWNKYTGWDGNVSHYNLYRVQRGEEPLSSFITLQPWVTAYDDLVEPFIQEFGEFCYYIEAVENFNSFGFSRNSWSRETCASQNPIIWVPNAIVLGGVNTEFKPVGGFLNVENYSMNIFNRWGQEIFASDDIELGWQGEYKGSIVPQGVYFYYIRYQGGDGTVFEKRGDVYFINAEH